MAQDNWDDDLDNLVVEEPTSSAAGHFFGAPAAEPSTAIAKTIKIEPQQTPRKPSQTELSHQSTHPSWFGNETGQDSSFFGIGEPQQVPPPLDHNDPFAFSAVSNATDSTREQQSKPFSGTSFSSFSSNIPNDPQQRQVPSESHLSSEFISEIEEPAFIGDETFDRSSSISGSLSALDDSNMFGPDGCPRCHRINDPQAIFCQRCGMQLLSHVPSSLFPSHLHPQEPSSQSHLSSVRRESHQSQASSQMTSSFPKAANPSYEASYSNEHVFQSHSETLQQPQQLYHQPQRQAEETFYQFPHLQQPPRKPLDLHSQPSSRERHQYDEPLNAMAGSQSSLRVQPTNPGAKLDSFSPHDLPALRSASSRSSLHAAPLVSYAFPPQIPKASQSFAHPPQESTQVDSFTHATAAPSIKQSKFPVCPAFCFGYGGQFFVTFPIKQMRFAVTPGSHAAPQGISHDRPGPMYRIRLATFASINETIIRPILESYQGVPITDKFIKSKDVVKILDHLIQETPEQEKLASKKIALQILKLILTTKGGLGSVGNDAIRKILLSGPSSPRLAPLLASSDASAGANAQVLIEMTKMLVHGARADAVQLALSNQMWAHALLISSHVDRETYSSVISEFARHSLPIGHPLRSLYLLFAGQSDLASTFVYIPHWY